MINISSNFLKEAKQNGIRYIVKLSVMGADLESGTTIGGLHSQEEKTIEWEYGELAIILLLAMIVIACVTCATLRPAIDASANNVAPTNMRTFCTTMSSIRVS